MSRRSEKPRPEIPELMGVAEVAECLGIVIQNLSGRNIPVGLPEPVVTLKATRVWLGEDIRAFKLEFDARRRARNLLQ